MSSSKYATLETTLKSFVRLQLMLLEILEPAKACQYHHPGCILPGVPAVRPVQHKFHCQLCCSRGPADVRFLDGTLVHTSLLMTPAQQYVPQMSSVFHSPAIHSIADQEHIRPSPCGSAVLE